MPQQEFIKGYQRKKGYRYERVTGYRRIKRRVGKKIKYKKVGDFYIAQDQYGNVLGSKIVTKKQKPKKPKYTIKRLLSFK